MKIKKEIKEKTRKEHVPYTTFIENTLSLPFQLRKIYFYILERGKSTAAEISKNSKIGLEIVDKALRQLIQNGFIKSTKDEETYYFIPKTRKIPRVKQGFTWKSFLGPPVPPIYHYNLLCDTLRVEKLRKVILNAVNDGDIVADLGTGTGILALFAAEKAEKIYAVEIDLLIIEAAQDIANNHHLGKKIEFIEENANNVKLDEKVDVVICEMVDTALIREQQTPVMNYAIEKLLKPGGKVIPLKALTYIELVNSNYEFYGYDFRLPFYEKCGARHIKDILSKREPFHSIRFDEVNPVIVDKEVTVEAIKNGFINSFRLVTYVYANENILMKPSEWFNPPLILPLTDEDGRNIQVKKGQNISISLSYEMGSGLDYILTFANMNDRPLKGA